MFLRYYADDFHQIGILHIETVLIRLSKRALDIAMLAVNEILPLLYAISVLSEGYVFSIIWMLTFFTNDTQGVCVAGWLKALGYADGKTVKIIAWVIIAIECMKQ